MPASHQPTDGTHLFRKYTPLYETEQMFEEVFFTDPVTKKTVRIASYTIPFALYEIDYEARTNALRELEAWRLENTKIVPFDQAAGDASC